MTVYHGKDATVKLANSFGTTSIGYATSFTFDITSNTEGQYYIGSRKVEEYERGNLEITGSLEKYYVDNDYMKRASGTALTKYEIEGRVEDEAGNWKKATLTGLVFTDDSLDFTSDDTLTESLDFQAKDITFSSG